MTDTEFHDLKVLAQTDLAGFVAARRALIERMISATDPARRETLWRLQGEVELMRATTLNVEHVALKLAGMISERLDALNVAFARLATSTDPHSKAASNGWDIKHRV